MKLNVIQFNVDCIDNKFHDSIIVIIELGACKINRWTKLWILSWSSSQIWWSRHLKQVTHVVIINMIMIENNRVWNMIPKPTPVRNLGRKQMCRKGASHTLKKIRKTWLLTYLEGHHAMPSQAVSQQWIIELLSRLGWVRTKIFNLLNCCLCMQIVAMIATEESSH